MVLDRSSKKGHKNTRNNVANNVAIPKRKSKKKKEVSIQPLKEDDTEVYQEPVKRIVKPDNQLVLTDAKLQEEVTRVLTGDDPNVPSNGISKFNFKDQCFKLDPPGQSDHMAIHFSMEGTSLYIDSPDYIAQKEWQEKKSEEDAVERKSRQQEVGTDEDCAKLNSALGSTEVAKNQFNFSDRAAQTFNNALRCCGVKTEPPPVAQYSETVSQYQIYDSYVKDYEISLLGDYNDRKKKILNFDDSTCNPLEQDAKIGKDALHTKNMERSLKVLERLANQNAQDDVFQDFKYWEDASDQYREGEGSLLPLWRFSTERTKRKQVTAICWNPRYSDLFAVAYGSYDFMRQGSGMVCCFTLKNTYPEYLFATESGVMSLDFHPQHPSLLAVGCYDGSVMVYNVSNGSVKPIYSSSVKTGKHKDTVWQVHWQSESMGKELNFYSISSDGCVANWSMSKNELKMELVMQLKLVNRIKDEPEEFNLGGLASGCCFDFNQSLVHLFIVGTEEGNIHQCSLAYSGQYLETYEGHHMTVYTVKWNPFHDRVFISCSADWTVKIWDRNFKYPLMSFDLDNAVGDVCWSPYSSTVFSAVTSDGKVHVFDLAENKHEPLCQQKVAKRAKSTNVCFNHQDPILIVGDDRGGVNSLKLSPNLRKAHLLTDNTGKLIPDTETRVAQRNNMEKLLETIDVKRPAF